MSPAELQKGKLNARQKFYRPSSVLKRLFGNLSNPAVYLAMNYGHMKQVKVEKKRLSLLQDTFFNQCKNN